MSFFSISSPSFCIFFRSVEWLEKQNAARYQTYKIIFLSKNQVYGFCWLLSGLNKRSLMPNINLGSENLAGMLLNFNQTNDATYKNETKNSFCNGHERFL